MDKGIVGEESKGKEMDGCPLTELTRSSLGDHCLAEDLSLEVSEALGISLSEVQA
jgi:hypothetical protein